MHLALAGIGVTKNDEVIVPTLTFIAPINSVSNMLVPHLYFLDCDDYLNLDINKVIEFLNTKTYFKNGYTYNKNTKKIIKPIVVVHVFWECFEFY